MVSRTSTDHTSALPSIYIPPWAGGVPIRGLPLGVIGRDVPEVHPSGPHDPDPLVSMTIIEKCPARNEGHVQSALPPTVPPAAARREPYAAGWRPVRSWARR